MKILFPIALAVAWVVMAALTMADFAGFYAAVHATETINVTSTKPRRKLRAAAPPAGRSVARPSVARPSDCPTTEALHD
jgi:hypothetical protein